MGGTGSSGEDGRGTVEGPEKRAEDVRGNAREVRDNEAVTMLTLARSP